MIKYVTRKISRETAGEWGLPLDLAETKDAHEKYPELAYLVDKEENEHRRWYYTTTLVFEAPDDHKLWGCDYYTGLTEYQDMDDWYDQKEIILTLVQPVEITVVKYAKVREEE